MKATGNQYNIQYSKPALADLSRYRSENNARLYAPQNAHDECLLSPRLSTDVADVFTAARRCCIPVPLDQDV